ncbi:hypothetical protein B1207_14515 [Legionella quinlivanii]|uniref:Transmembrane protein n=1 Tax=Legionella quinlivanii TaxID=45073 RepID=A0A364LFR0_9GAMM|nr:hypothetical protein [Legionella quinlivanii]RAP34903.1 hypothetical protein B1207_14515 [Legionella quinlivanii]
MKHNELQQAIAEDIKRLKQLELDIIPARIYYTGLLKLSWRAFWKIGTVFFFAILYVSLTELHSNALAPGLYWEQTRDALLASLMMTIAALIVLIPSLIHYFLIQYHLQNQLKTGVLLVKKLQCCAWLFWGVFIFYASVFASYAELAALYFMLGIAFFGSAMVTYMMMSLEFNRVGLSILLTSIQWWLGKDNPSSL